MATHYRACNLCEAICGLEIVVDGGRVASIAGDRADPFSRGHICPKAVALIDLQDDPNRLRGPVRRTPGGWEPIAWADAFALAAERLAAIVAEHGDDAVATYHGNPNVHSLGLMTHQRALFGHIRTRNRFSATSLDQLPHQLVARWMYGHQLLVPIPDVDRTAYLLVIGANPLVSNGSMMTVPDVRKRLRDLRARGGRLVVIDPRRTETAVAADEHHFIRPGSDAAFLLALLHVVVHESGATPGRLAPLLAGFAAVTAAVAATTPERAEAATGIAAAQTRAVALAFARAPSAVAYGRMGTCTQRHGTLCQWLIQLLNVATGNLDREGGSLVTKPAVDLVAAAVSKPGGFARWKSRVSGKPEALGELPAAVLAEEILTPGQGRVRALVAVAGNPVLSAPNGRRVDEALAALEFMVAIDPYVNETSRHADLILPGTTALERDHYDLVFNHLAVRNVARYGPAVLPKPAGALHDWEILQGLGDALADRLGVPRKSLPPPDVIVNAGLRMGPYALSLQRLRDVPHGLDLGPLTPSFPERLATPDKRIDCAPAPLLAALAAAEEELFAPPAPALRLIGRRDLRSNNSWMHDVRRLVRGKERCDLLMHPDDVARLGLRDGGRVRVRSRAGSVDVPLRASDAMMPGVVSLPHGWGRSRASANDLTDDEYLDAVTGNAAFNGVPVTVETV